MNVLVIGANGQIGKFVVEQLAQEGKHKVTAMIRKPEQADALKELGADVVIGDLEGSVEDLAEAMKDHNAIVFTAGSGGSTGQDKTLLIDLDGAVKTMEAAEQQGISRYILVSAYGADQREKWSESIKPYYVAKHYADRALFASDLNYTIIRPGGLKNELAQARSQLEPIWNRGVSRVKMWPASSWLPCRKRRRTGWPLI